MSGLFGWFGLSQPPPVIHNQPPPPPPLPSEPNPFYYDTIQSINHYDPYKEEDEKEDYEEYEENLEDYSPKKMTTNQEISIGNYQIMNPTPLLEQQYGTQYSNIISF